MCGQKNGFAEFLSTEGDLDSWAVCAGIGIDLPAVRVLVEGIAIGRDLHREDLLGHADRIDQRLIEAARDLGAPPSSAFRRVVLPLSKAGTLGGIVLIALPMFGDYYTPDLMSGSPKTAMLGNTVNNYVQGGPDKALGAALTMLLSAFLLVFMLYYLRILRRDEVT